MRLPSSTPGVDLGATLDAPASGAEPIAVVVLLSGSGPQDRDQTVAGHPTFRVLREHLRNGGFAAVSWDDRGVGDSGGDYGTATSDTLVADARQVIAAVADRFPGAPVVVAGHSQGTHVATRVAVEDSAVAGLVLMAGAARPGRAVLLDQHRRICRAEGWPSEAVDASLAWKAACLDRLAEVPETVVDPPALDALGADLNSILTAHLGPDPGIDAMVADLLEWEWRFLLRFDASSWLERVSVPTLVVAGAVDTQIDAPVELEAARASLERGHGPPVEAMLLPGLNHLFQRADTGAPGEYGALGEPFDPEVARRIAEWIHRTMA